jgi:hypothetical protein
MEIGGIDLWYETPPGTRMVDAAELALIREALLLAWPDAVILRDDDSRTALKDSAELWVEGCELFIFHTPEAVTMVGDFDEMLTVYCEPPGLTIVVETPWLALGCKLIIESADRMGRTALNYKKGAVVPVERT